MAKDVWTRWRRAVRRHRWIRWFLGNSSTAAAALVAIQLGVSFAFVYVSGGTDRVPPHWFYLPVIFAGVRFGIAGAVPTAAVAGVLAGPLAPADVATGAVQQLSDWTTRGFFFVVVGVALPLLLKRTTATVQQERRAQRTEAAVRRALTHDEFVLHYQPVVSLDDRTIVGAEALLRWQHPERGLLTPVHFLADLERVGSIDTWVLRQACNQTQHWRDQHLADDQPFVISVNISAAKLGQPDFVNQVHDALQLSGLDPHNLCLEITETALIDDLAIASARLDVLRSIGVKIAVDDYGTGHSSLVYLRNLPVDQVKIDRQFVVGVQHQPRDRAIVDNIVTLAHSLDATCVAEGIETFEQLEHVTALGCRQAQGYYFSRPQPAEQIPTLIAGFADAAHIDLQHQHTRDDDTT